MKNISRFTAALLAAVLILCCAAAAAAQLDNVTDGAGLLSPAERLYLDSEAKKVENAYNFGIYAVIVDDWRNYVSASSVKQATDHIYDGYELGTGERHDGLLLVLSMAEREYAIITGNNFSDMIFTDSALDRVEAQFLDNFKQNDWYGGLRDYISAAERELASGYERAVDRQNKIDSGSILYAGGREPAVNAAIVLGLPIIIALFVCGVFAYQMKSARTATEAGNYMNDNSLRFSVRTDNFTHTTRTVTKIQTNRSGSGGGGGHSGHSGHF